MSRVDVFRRRVAGLKLLLRQYLNGDSRLFGLESIEIAIGGLVGPFGVPSSGVLEDVLGARVRRARRQVMNGVVAVRSPC